jgi:hypothetical protein
VIIANKIIKKLYWNQNCQWLTSYKIFSQAYVLCIQDANILNINTDNKIIAGYPKCFVIKTESFLKLLAILIPIKLFDDFIRYNHQLYCQLPAKKKINKGFVYVTDIFLMSNEKKISFLPNILCILINI